MWEPQVPRFPKSWSSRTWVRTGGNPHDLFLETSIINHYEVSLKIINIIYTTVIKQW